MNQIVSAVFHGPAAFLAARVNGEAIFTGKAITALTNAEEENFGTVEDIPIALETEIRKLGGRFETADALWGVKVVVDGDLITGQNPGSSQAVGEALLKRMSERGY